MLDSKPAVAQLRPIEDVRAEFPGLRDDWAAFDGAAGTKVPQAVIEAVSQGLRAAMSHDGGRFDASLATGEVVDRARTAVADLVGGAPEGVVFGPNMTTLTFLFADALSREWRGGDEVVLTTLDHDANVRPWVVAAERAGATVRFADFDPETGELPAAAVSSLLGPRTRLVALTSASNAIGTRPDVRAVSDAAHAAGALTYVDGVHATPHAPTDVRALGADLYACSSYKFCGPHTGAVIADPGLLERIRPPKLAPASDEVPHRFERGTPAYELLAGVSAAVDWLADLTDADGTRRERLLASFGALEARLQVLLERLVTGLEAIEGIRLLGRPRRRTSTVSFLVGGLAPDEVVRRLAERRIAVWDGDNYAFELMRRFGLSESGGAVRASIVLYNTAAEVDRLLEAVAALAGR